MKICCKKETAGCLEGGAAKDKRESWQSWGKDSGFSP